MSDVEHVVTDLKSQGDRYRETIRVPSMSVGVYLLPRGAEDRPRPHTEDEVYYVVRGRGIFRRAEEELTVAAGQTLFVPAGQPHRFHDIEEELVLLVVFAPAERATP